VRLHVVFTEQGHILAAARADGSAPIKARPAADEKSRQQVAELDVPAEYHGHDLRRVAEELRVDSAGRSPALKPRT
jgi:hypothetical protein